MKRPFLIVALLYIGGITLGELCQPPLPALFAVSLATALIAIFWSTRRVYFLAALLVLAGWTNQSYRTAIISPNDLRLLLGNQTNIVQLRGTLCSSPTERIFERDQQEMWRSSAMVDISEINRGTNWEPAAGKVSVSTMGVLSSNFFTRQNVVISNGVIRTPNLPQAPGLFDSQAYLKRKGVYYQVNATTNDWHVFENGPTKAMPLPDRFHIWAKKTLALGIPQEDLSLRLMWTLILDWKAPMTEPVEEPFMKAGTYHIFAVDGLRIGMITAILITFFRVLQIPRTLSGFCTIPAIWFYTALTGYPASAIRAAIMMSVIIVGWAIRRPGNLLNSLFGAAFLILLWDPQQLFQAGFQLSFFVVLCIALLMPPLEKVYHDLFKSDPFLPVQLRPRWPQWARSSGHFAWETFAVSLAAWLGSLPLSAHYFHLFNPVSIIANWPVVPLTMVAVISGFASLVVGAWWPGCAELFNHASWLLMNWITWFSQWCADWPCAFWNVATPSPLTFIGCYGVMLAVLTGWMFRTKHKRLVLAAIAGVAVLLLVQWRGESQTVQMHVLSLRGGHSIFIDSFGSSRDLLVDCGDAYSADSITETFLCAQGVNELPSLCFSHATQGQMGGYLSIETNFPIHRFYTSSARGRSPGYRRFLKELEKTPERRQIVKAGDAIGFWKVLYPEGATRSTTADDNAVVLYGRIRDQSILLLSGLSRVGQNRLVEQNPDLRADIIVAGLPTKDEPVCDWLLDTFQPKLIIIADSEFPAQRRASPRLHERLAQRKTPVLYCRELGSITLRFEPEGRTLWTAEETQLDVNSMHGDDPLPEPPTVQEQ